jgi:TPR repeat protein
LSSSERLHNNAKAGKAWAQAMLAVELYDGTSVVPTTHQNKRQALKWFKVAAEQGHRDAQYRLGRPNENGDRECRIQKSIERAKEYYTAAIYENASPECLFSMAWICLEDDGDEDKALRCFTLSAAQGLKEAQHALGSLFKEGNRCGLNQSFDSALFWMKKAALQKDVNAIEALPYLLLNCSKETITGGPSQYYPEALYWARQSQGRSRGPERLQHLETMMAKICSHCLVRLADSGESRRNRCSKGHATYYCGRKCQAEHWKTGQREDCYDKEKPNNDANKEVAKLQQYCQAFTLGGAS